MHQSASFREKILFLLLLFCNVVMVSHRLELPVTLVFLVHICSIPSTLAAFRLRTFKKKKYGGSRITKLETSSNWTNCLRIQHFGANILVTNFALVHTLEKQTV